MRLRIWCLIIFFLFSQVAGAQVLQTLSGFAVSVNPAARELRVLFEHPVTGENTVKVFQVQPNTGFKNVKRLEQIKPNDPVSIDFEEEGDSLKAVYVEVIPLKEVPFTAKDVRKQVGLIGR